MVAAGWDHQTVAARRERNESRNYRLVRLYLGDVEEIERALSALGPNTSEVEFSNGEWEAETIAELAAKGEGPFSEFGMRRYGPGLVSFDTNGSTTRLYVSNADDLQLRGAFEKIDSILTAAQPPLIVRWLHSGPAWGVLAALGMTAAITAIGVAVSMLRGDSPPGWIAPVCLAVLALVFVASRYLNRTTLRENGLVYLVPKSARPNFLLRKRDDLAMLLIGGVFGAVLTLLVERL